MDTDEVVIRLSDLDGRYDMAAESEIYRSNASEDVRTQFEEKEILKQHKRLFETENRSLDTPIFLISSIAVYESRSDAARDLEASVEALGERGEVSTMAMNNSAVTVVRYRDQQQNYQTVAYLQRSNTVFYTLTTDDDEYRQEIALRLLAEMDADMGPEAVSKN